MNYKGKLYGKVGNKYFDTGITTDDITLTEPLLKNIQSIDVYQVVQELKKCSPHVRDYVRGLEDLLQVSDNTLQRALSKIKELSAPEPEPLDPYTCDLMVGDVVEAGFGIFFWDNLIVVGQNNDGAIVLYCSEDGYIKRFFRSMLKLTHRNGAKIKEGRNG